VRIIGGGKKGVGGGHRPVSAPARPVCGGRHRGCACAAASDTSLPLLRIVRAAARPSTSESAREVNVGNIGRQMQPPGMGMGASVTMGGKPIYSDMISPRNHGM
jgi:hypothetical protein